MYASRESFVSIYLDLLGFYSAVVLQHLDEKQNKELAAPSLRNRDPILLNLKHIINVNRCHLKSNLVMSESLSNRSLLPKHVLQ